MFWISKLFHDSWQHWICIAAHDIIVNNLKVNWIIFNRVQKCSKLLKIHVINMIIQERPFANFQFSKFYTRGWVPPLNCEPKKTVNSWWLSRVSCLVSRIDDLNFWVKNFKRTVKLIYSNIDNNKFWFISKLHYIDIENYFNYQKNVSKLLIAMFDRFFFTVVIILLNYYSFSFLFSCTNVSKTKKTKSNQNSHKKEQKTTKEQTKTPPRLSDNNDCISFSYCYCSIVILLIIYQAQLCFVLVF